jgi:hypothetical protein
MVRQWKCGLTMNIKKCVWKHWGMIVWLEKVWRWNPAQNPTYLTQWDAEASSETCKEGTVCMYAPTR